MDYTEKELKNHFKKLQNQNNKFEISLFNKRKRCLSKTIMVNTLLSQIDNLGFNWAVENGRVVLMDEIKNEEQS